MPRSQEGDSATEGIGRIIDIHDGVQEQMGVLGGGLQVGKVGDFVTVTSTGM